MMIEEAVNILNTIEFAAALNAFDSPIGVPIPFGRQEIADACHLATKTLEKQIPKKPNYDHCTDKIACCAVCGLHISRIYRLKHCPECGQAIDWEEGAEE